MRVGFCCILFSFSVISRDSGWEWRLWDGWSVMCRVGHKTLTQSTQLYTCDCTTLWNIWYLFHSRWLMVFLCYPVHRLLMCVIVVVRHCRVNVVVLFSVKRCMLKWLLLLFSDAFWHTTSSFHISTNPARSNVLTVATQSLRLSCTIVH